MSVLDCHHLSHPCVLLILVLYLRWHTEVATLGWALVDVLVWQIQLKFGRWLLRLLLNLLKVENIPWNRRVSIKSKMFRNEIVITF